MSSTSPWIPGDRVQQPGQKWAPNVATTVNVGGVKLWTGSAWKVCPVRVWNGTRWVGGPTKTWTGSAWKQL